MEDISYLNQVIEDLRQLRARVAEASSVPELREIDRLKLSGMLVNAISHLPPPRSPQKAPDGLEELKDRLRGTADELGRDIELGRALAAISPDFSVEAIDNAIRVTESKL